VRSHGTGWAVGAWFVPILNLWRPLEIARDIWRGSDPDRPEASRGTERIPGLLACWWGFFVVSNLASNAASRLAFRGDTPEDVRDTALAFLVGDALDLVAAGLAVAVVHHATSRQEERRARRRFEGEPVTPA